MQTTALDTFIDELISEKGFIHLTPEMHDTLEEHIKERLDEFIMARSLTQFSDEEIEQFKKLLEEKKTKVELRQFAREHVSDYPAFLTNTISQFREAYLS